MKIDEKRIVRSVNNIEILGNVLETLIPTDCSVAITDEHVGVFITTEKLLKETPLRVSASITNGGKYYPTVNVRGSIDSNTRCNYTIKNGQELGHLIITELKTIDSDDEQSDSDQLL